MENSTGIRARYFAFTVNVKVSFPLYDALTMPPLSLELVALNVAAPGVGQVLAGALLFIAMFIDAVLSIGVTYDNACRRLETAGNPDATCGVCLYALPALMSVLLHFFEAALSVIFFFC